MSEVKQAWLNRNLLVGGKGKRTDHKVRWHRRATEMLFAIVKKKKSLAKAQLYLKVAESVGDNKKSLLLPRRN